MPDRDDLIESFSKLCLRAADKIDEHWKHMPFDVRANLNHAKMMHEILSYLHTLAQSVKVDKRKIVRQ